MHLPAPLRAAVGLVVTAADEAKHLPDRAIELPMLAVSTALQMSLRAQQRYARLAARGDEVLNRTRTGDEPPEWATFDEPVSVDELHRAAMAQLHDVDADDPDDAGVSSALLTELFGTADPSDVASEAKDDADDAPASTPAPAAQAPARKAPATRASATKAPATNAPAKKAAAKKATAPAKKAGSRTSAARTTGAKTVSAPRHTPPSRFDAAGDGADDAADTPDTD